MSRIFFRIWGNSAIADDLSSSNGFSRSPNSMPRCISARTANGSGSARTIATILFSTDRGRNGRCSVKLRIFELHPRFARPPPRNNGDRRDFGAGEILSAPVGLEDRWWAWRKGRLLPPPRILRSPDGAKRNPGKAPHVMKVPGYASLHPGYTNSNFKQPQLRDLAARVTRGLPELPVL